MKIYSLFLYNMKMEFRKNYFLWLAVPFFFLSGILFEAHAVSEAFLENLEISPSLGDVFFYIFAGKEPFRIQENTVFLIPAVWMTILTGSCLTVLSYGKEYWQFEQQLFIRCRNRSQWWVVRCLCNITVTLSYYVIGILILAAIALWKKWAFSMNCTEILLPFVNDRLSAANTAFVGKLLLSVIFGSVMWNLFQMYLSLYLKNVTYILISLFMLVISVYLYSPFLPGNYLMFLRSQYVYENGMNYNAGILYFSALGFLAFSAGLRKFQRMDYLNTERKE